MQQNRRFSGLKVLVTGAGTGIGREIGIAFGCEGADVVLHFLNETDGAFSAKGQILQCGGRAEAVSADFRHMQNVFDLADSALEFLGGIDILINNAGITMNKPLLKITPEQFDILYAVNVRAQLFLIQKLVPHMLERGGSIVNISSIHGLQGAPEHAVYAGTKGAVIAHTRTLGVELAHKGIRVNAVAPGWTHVPSHSHVFPGRTEESAMRDAEKSIPLGRAGLPTDIARVVLFLCSEDANFIVGQTIVADGGTTALMSLVSDFRDESHARCGLGYVPGV